MTNCYFSYMTQRFVNIPAHICLFCVDLETEVTTACRDLCQQWLGAGRCRISTTADTGEIVAWPERERKKEKEGERCMWNKIETELKKRDCLEGAPVYARFDARQMLLEKAKSKKQR